MFLRLRSTSRSDQEEGPPDYVRDRSFWIHLITGIVLLLVFSPDFYSRPFEALRPSLPAWKVVLAYAALPLELAIFLAFVAKRIRQQATNEKLWWVIATQFVLNVGIWFVLWPLSFP